MNYYEAKISGANFKADATPAMGAPKGHLEVKVSYGSELRALPKINELIVTNSFESLQVRIQDKIAELDKKAELFLAVTRLTDVRADVSFSELLQDMASRADTEPSPAT